MAFADLFEAAILEESMSLDSMDEASAASTSINLLSLGPKTSVGCGLTRQFSTGPGKNLGFIRGPFLASNGLLPDIYREGCLTQTCRSCTLWSRSACRTRRGNGSMSASPSRGALQSRADHHRCRSPCTASRSSSRCFVRWQILVQPPLVCLNVDAAFVLSLGWRRQPYRGKFGSCPADAKERK